ncbi:MAG TPA: RNA 2',3'-cyclic phosphodiesterase [Verrucomicrobiae bacterium]|jgi:2'-5' RNA ligase
MRAFIALPVASEVQEKLRGVIAELDRALPRGAVKWSRADQIHITLRFLGSVPDTAPDEIAARLRTATAGVGSLSLRAEQFGAFPDLDRARVLWVGVTGDIEAARELQRRITEATAAFGDKEEREFSPHLTLGRVKNLPPLEVRRMKEVLLQFRVDDLGGWMANRVQLMRSELSPGGSRYTELAAIPLAAT